MKRKFFLLISLLMFTMLSYAQQRFTLSGTVKDSDGDPVIASTVTVEGTSRGAITDGDGKFSISVSSGESVIVSYIGFDDFTFIVGGNSRTNIEVILTSQVQDIEDVVVVGYGTQRREAVVGAISDVSGQDIRNSGLTNVTHAIQDALPGVTASIQSGQPGDDDASLTIRGQATFGGSNDPLILVDEIEVSGGFSAINPTEIASISVLKDASATAVYGSRGANGVILITTRRGSQSKPRVTVSASVTAKTPVSIPDQVGSYDALMLGQDAAKNSNYFGAVRSQEYINNFLDPDRNQYLYPDVDWYDELVKDWGWEESASVSVSGGTEHVKYFSSLSYDHVGDIMNVTNIDGTYDPSFDYKKYNFRTNLDFKLSNTTQLRVDVSGRSSITNTPNTGLTPTDAQNIYRDINNSTAYYWPMYYPEEFLEEYPDAYDPDAGLRLSGTADNRTAYYNLNYYGYYRYTQQVVDMKVGLDQDLDFITKGLKAYGTFNYSNSYTYSKSFPWMSREADEDRIYDVWYFNPATMSWEGYAYNETYPSYHPTDSESLSSVSRNLFYEGKLAYDRTFAEDHNVSAVGVFNRTIYYGTIGDFPSYLENWVGRLTYNYKSKYFLEVNAAYNGTDKFASGHRFGLFPSMAIGWNIAGEKFVKDNLPFVNEFKVRYSAGFSGYEGSADDYMYMSGWDAVSLKNSCFQDGYPWTDTVARYSESQMGNVEASWELAYKQNFGIDAKFFKNKLSVSFDVYRESRTGILLSDISGSMFNAGINEWSDYAVDLPKTNVGEMKSQGFEVEASYRGRINKDLSYTIGGNVAFNENVVIYRADYPYSDEYQKNAGKPYGWISNYQTNGFVTSFEEQINSVNTATYATGGTQPGTYIYSDYNFDGYIDTNDRVPSGHTSQPAWVYGFNFGVNYKQWNLTARFYGKGDVWYSANLDYVYVQADSEYIIAREEHLGNIWSFDNQDASYPVLMSHVTNPSYAANSSNLVNGSYLKLKSVQLRYLLSDDGLQSKLGIQNLSIYLTGDNLYSWDHLPYGDPEGGNAVVGNGNYPLVRRYILGVDFNF